MKILCVVGARPNFMKIAPILRALAEEGLPAKLVHTGQHYDAGLNDTLFTQLGIPDPDVNLGVGSGTHAVQTAEIMKRFEPVVDANGPCAVLVVGDVNSTIACALVAVKKNVPVIHVEAGLRSYDREMPEEVNRVLTDALADLLFTTEREAEANLVREGIDGRRVRFVGNVMIDTLYACCDLAVPAAETLAAAVEPALFLENSNGYGVVTLHRPSNVDTRATLEPLLAVLRELSEQVPFVFPMHPRTQAKVNEHGLTPLLDTPRILVLPPAGYLEIIGLMKTAKLVLTDSGGLQEETTALGVPCLTVRENTERPITITQGTNMLVGSDPVAIRAAVWEVLVTGGKVGRQPELWDGQAARRIAHELKMWWLSYSKRKS